MINPAAMMKMKKNMAEFTEHHPRFVQFLDVVRNEAIEEGTIIEINVTKKDGKTLSSNMRITEEDLALLNELKNLM